MRTVSFTTARSNLKQVLDRVVADADATIITRRDADDVVIMSLDTWNSWQETEYLLSSPTNAVRLAKSIADLDAGRGKTRSLLNTSKRQLKVAEPTAEYGPVRRKRKTAGTDAAKRKTRTNKPLVAR